MITFSDVLLQLLAFFILRLSIAPYRQGSIIKPGIISNAPLKPPGQLAQNPEDPEQERLRRLKVLNFRPLPFADGIQAEMDMSTLPERVDEISFSLSEDISTFGSTFGGGSYLFTLSQSHCDGDEEKKPRAAIMAEELIQHGVPPECLQWGEDFSCEEQSPPSGGKMRITILEKRCDPFSSVPAANS